MQITAAELKIVRETANLFAINGSTVTATQVCTAALGDGRWDALSGECVRDAIRAVDAGRRIAAYWHPTEPLLVFGGQA